MKIKIISTEDGSHSLLNEEMNETYHSTRGAKGESMHVFIKEGLQYWFSQNLSKETNILEVGLGTGLNALLTANLAEERQQRIYYTSLEPYPIKKGIYRQLNYSESEEEQALFLKIHEATWEEDILVSPFFEFHKTVAKLEGFNSSRKFDVIYFDAFAPAKQPEVWSINNLQKCHSFLNNGGILSTYCAQGQFKRNLAASGFKVETLRGALGKKEMVRGIKH